MEHVIPFSQVQEVYRTTRGERNIARAFNGQELIDKIKEDRLAAI